MYLVPEKIRIHVEWEKIPSNHLFLQNGKKIVKLLQQKGLYFKWNEKNFVKSHYEVAQKCTEVEKVLSNDTFILQKRKDFEQGRKNSKNYLDSWQKDISRDRALLRYTKFEFLDFFFSCSIFLVKVMNVTLWIELQLSKIFE